MRMKDALQVKVTNYSAKLSQQYSIKNEILLTNLQSDIFKLGLLWLWYKYPYTFHG